MQLQTTPHSGTYNNTWEYPRGCKGGGGGEVYFVMPPAHPFGLRSSWAAKSKVISNLSILLERDLG